MGGNVTFVIQEYPDLILIEITRNLAYDAETQ